MRRSLAFAPALALGIAACSPDDPPPEREVPESCDVFAETLASDRGIVVGIAAGGQEAPQVVWIEREGAPSTPTQIWRSDLATGGEPELLRTSRPDEDVVSVAVAGETVVYLERRFVKGPSRLYRLDDTPTRLSQREWEGQERILGADAEAVYVLHDDDGPAVDRVDLKTGDAARLGQVDRGAIGSHPRLQGADVFFRSTPFGVGAQPALYRLGVSDRRAEAEPVGDVGDAAGCGFPPGGLWVTDRDIVCGFESVLRFDRATGRGEEEVAGPEGDRRQVPVGGGDDEVYVIDLGDGSVDTPLRALDLQTGADRPLACDVRTVLNGTRSGTLTDRTSYQLAQTSDFVVWVEGSRPDPFADLAISIRAAAR